VRLVLGLGNPGSEYAATRHNVGWRVLDALAERGRAMEGARHRLYRVRTMRLGGHPGALLQPLTFMNGSGEALAAWWSEHPGTLEELLVVSDDVYLPVGTLRLRASGSSGGHRGLESLEEAVGHRGFARLRIGVGAAADAAALREHVLDRFTSEEESVVAESVARAADAVEMWAARGIAAAMNAFNTRTAQEGSTS
jgi:PTH1 family peptidyl-tRNA hydrolase